MPQSPEKKVFTPQESRQGLKGSPVLIILVISLLLAGAVWIVAETWGESTAPATTETQPAPGPSTPNAPADPGAQGTRSFDNNTPAGAAPATGGTDSNPNPGQAAQPAQPAQPAP
ncbi:hypothetical protein [Agrobacterium rubi]|uniref:Uncharacterized protein n=2 Tax=Agrobacterium rubi TaxID=28099 RepID=A0AAE7R276_9HYPH|nr:hypothetical protein [Agrobacterium rubi]MBP1880136.1 cytoskeletal protein RodZ [Agrobacterium rubi]MCL6652290.1 hypothetical protein [Agrobacterium rubi]NTE85507.1 hypothetical protein [Agrobacterium rubi]NTF01439.1 hypothetical protein [Agrobacterium rubi]NTF06563.1 hypothetical protein [Agrobacterium rubi]